METARYFRIRENPDIMANIVSSVPSSWLHVSGQLSGKGLEENIEQSVGIIVSSSRLEPAFCCNGQNAVENKKAIIRVMLQNKLPGFIAFGQAGAGTSSGDFTFTETKVLAMAFLRKGYTGNLTFLKSGNGSLFRARCNMQFQGWYGSPGPNREYGNQPARVKVEWNPGLDGSPDDVKEIIACCQWLKLIEYEPFANCGTQYSSVS